MSSHSECAQCGAPQQHAGVGRCIYCGAPIGARGSRPKGAKSSNNVLLALVVVVVGIGAITIVGVVVALAASLHSGDRTHVASPAPPPRPRPVHLRGPVCPIGDVDGDGVDDYATMLGPSTSRHQVARISGADGHVLTAMGDGTFYPLSYTWSFCPVQGWYGVAVDESMSVDLFHGDMLVPTHRIALSAEPSGFGRAEDCLRIRADDRSEVAVAVSTGERAECDARGDGYFGRGITGHSAVGGQNPSYFDICSGTDCFELSSGTRRNLNVRARRGDTERWAVELRFLRPNRNLAGVIADTILVVVGVRRRAQGGGLFAVGLELESGRERWAVQVGHNRVQMHHYNGRHVLLQQAGRLRALDPLTGDEMWHVGR